MSDLARRPRLLFAVTVSVSVGFYTGKYSYLRAQGFDVSVISSDGPELQHTRDEGAAAFAVPMQREISPVHDVISLWRLWRRMRTVRPDIAIVGTPKAGLLGGLAARMAGVPHRIYTLHGLRLETTRGRKRKLLIVAERVACSCAHRVHCVSPSLRNRAIELGLVSAEKAVVIGAGTSAGIDTAHFAVTPDARHESRMHRRQLGIDENAPVVGFVGRFTRDKGITELFQAFVRVRARHPRLRLLMVGDFETGDPVSDAIRQAIATDGGVIRTGFVYDVAPLYHLMDVCVLPTYREGFPGVPLQAQAAGVPVITTEATGAVDSVLHGKTGLIVPVGDVDALHTAIDALVSDPALRRRMGEAGCRWVHQEFRREIIWAAHLEIYKGLVSPAGMLAAKELRMSSRQRGWRLWIKRLVDRSAAVCGLLILSPLFLAMGLLVWISMGRPLLFRQERPGRCGKPFTLVKFRTMSQRRDKSGVLLPDAGRLTRVGRFLRATSLDELPQLWNVLRGDISLVGPRPLLMEYLPRYSRDQARRHHVLPGMTGWAQINGRNALSWEEKFDLDLWYVENWSVMLDIKIAAITLWRVLQRDGVSSQGHATMPEFLGERNAIPQADFISAFSNVSREQV